MERERLAGERTVERAERAEAECSAAMIKAAAPEGELAGLRGALAEARKPCCRRWLG